MKQTLAPVSCNDSSNAYAIHKAVWDVMRKGVGNDGHGRYQYLLMPDRQRALIRSAAIAGDMVGAPISGTRCKFYIEANPVNSIRNTKNTTYEPIIGEQEQMDWLAGRASGCGFSIADVDVSSMPPLRAVKNGIPWYINRAAFSGVLIVTDQDKFANTLHRGIGRSISFGLGMLIAEEIK